MNQSEIVDFLTHRCSTPAILLEEPAPDDGELATIIRCALAAPDHARLRPWRFIAIRGTARERLADVFVDVARRDDPAISAEKLESVRGKPLRAPLILVMVTTVTENHPKTPVVEQVLSTGAAATLAQLAANAMGFGSIWLSGPNAYDNQVKQALGVAEPDQIAGFMYLGTPRGERPVRDRPSVEAHLSEWSG